MKLKTDPAEEKSIESVFKHRAVELIENKEKFQKKHDKIRTGVETEYFLVREDLSPLEDEEVRNNIIEDLDRVKKELGIDSVEAATEPIYLNSLNDLEEKITEKEKLIKSKAKENNLEIIRSGTNPFRPLENLKLSNKTFFRQINDYYNEEKSELIGKDNKFDVGSSKAVSLISAIHTNLEASDFGDAIDKSNYIYMISPYISALSGNARLLEGKDTGLSDLRMILWEKSHSSGDKTIGSLDSYYSDMEDYLEKVGSWPFILGREDQVISDSVSRFWKDSRIKFIEDDLVVESRIASTQPSISEDTALHGFCIGRVLHAQDRDEELLDIQKVNENRKEAMRNGLESQLYNPEGEKLDAVEVLRKEIKKARKGLKAHNIEDRDYLDILSQRLKKKENPSERLVKEFESIDKKNSKALFTALETIRQEDL